MSAADVSQCAACGKGGDNLKACIACKLVKYSNVACQKTHRPNHKMECKKRAAEISDEALFKTPPPREDCPICFLRLPLDTPDKQYQECCGKIICNGCAYGEAMAGRSTELICPFCRAPPATSDEELIKQIEKRVDANDIAAMHSLGQQHFYGVPQDSNKALELWHRAAKLGCAKSHYKIGRAYNEGKVLEKDAKKAVHHFGLAAMGGDVSARHDLGVVEGEAGNMNRAIKHLMISAGFGHDESLKKIQDGFICGFATKDDFEKALRAHKESKDEMQSDQRDEARDIGVKLGLI